MLSVFRGVGVPVLMSENCLQRVTFTNIMLKIVEKITQRKDAILYIAAIQSWKFLNAGLHSRTLLHFKRKFSTHFTSSSPSNEVA